jgi:hypothetical protein
MRRIKSAKIRFISLVPRGANQLPVLYKSEDATAQFDCIVKADNFDEQGLLTAVVYVPNLADSQGDVADAQVIKQMAHDYITDMGAVDIKHNNVALDRAKVSVVESFLIQKNDSRFADMKDYSGRPVDATGGWGVVVRVDDAELRRLYREGHWNGVSMAGPAIVETIAKADNQKKEDDNMELKELEAALAKSNESLIAGLVKALTPPAAKEEQAPVIKFEGDPSDLTAVAAHERKLRAALVKWDDAKSVAGYKAELAKEAADKAAAEAAAKQGNKGKSPELIAAEASLAKAQAELTKAQKASNQGAGDSKDEGKGGDIEQLTGLSKADQNGMTIGQRMAKHLNSRR